MPRSFVLSIPRLAAYTANRVVVVAVVVVHVAVSAVEYPRIVAIIGVHRRRPLDASCSASLPKAGSIRDQGFVTWYP